MATPGAGPSTRIPSPVGAGDDVASPRRCAADLSVFGGADIDACSVVRDGVGSAGIQSDQVALDCVANGGVRVARIIVVDLNALIHDAGDNVAGTRRGPSNQVVGAADDDDPEKSAGVQGKGTRHVGTDVIPLDGLVAGLEHVQVPQAAGADDVAGKGRGAADGIVTRRLPRARRRNYRCPGRWNRSYRCRSGCPR